MNNIVRCRESNKQNIFNQDWEEHRKINISETNLESYI